VMYRRKKSGKGEYQSLGVWCNDLRKAYKKIQKGETGQYSATRGCRFQVDPIYDV